MPLQNYPAKIENILTNTEVKVLEIADQLAKAKKTITVELLFRKAKSILAATKIEISNAIYQLILKRFIIIGSKTTKTHVLKNQNRNRIHNYIVKNPGCRLSEIKAYMNIKGQLGKWHLSILEKFGFIFSVRYLKYLLFFPINFDRSIAIPFLSIKNPNAYKIFSAMWKNPVMDLTSLKSVVQTDLTTIKYHLGKLMDSKVVSIFKQSTKELFYLNPNLLNQLHILLQKDSEELQTFLNNQTRKLTELFRYVK